MSKQRLTDRLIASGISLNDLIHIVNTGDTTQNPYGSSFKGTVQQLATAIGGSSGLLVLTTSGSTGPSTYIGNNLNVPIYANSDTFVTGFTYNPTINRLTIERNQSQPDLYQTINSVSGLSFSNLTDGRVVYVGSGGLIIDQSGFTYDDLTNTLGVNTIGTSGDCVNDLFVSNIHSCSPLNINPLDEGNVYFGSTSGVTIDISNNRLGIGIDTPQYKLDVVNTNSRLFYESAFGGSLSISGATNLPRLGTFIPPYLTKLGAGGSVGMRSWDDATFPGYGKVGDMFIYSDIRSNGLNLISAAGSGTEDYIRFYAGQAATGIADLYIGGTGSTRGFVGIGTVTPTEILDVNGKTKTTTLQVTSNADINGNLTVIGNTLMGNVTATTISATTYDNLPPSVFSGGTVTGPTTFTNGLTATTISATTYYNLPIDPDTFVTGFTYNNNLFTVKQNNGQPDLTAVINSVTGWTVNGNLTVTGNTSVQGLTATTISATTYQNLPIDPDTFTTGYTYNENTFTIKQNNGQPDLTATINSVTGMTVNGDLTVTGNTSLQSTTASTVTVTNRSGTPSQVASFDTGGKLVAGVGTLGQTKYSAFGTSTLTITNATVGYQLIPGLTQAITVPNNCSVYVFTSGGMQNSNGSSNSFTVDVSLFVDGVGPLSNGSFRRITTTNPNTVNSAYTSALWSMGALLNLSAANHTIDVRAIFRNTSAGAVSGLISSDLTLNRQGELYIMIIKN